MVAELVDVAEFHCYPLLPESSDRTARHWKQKALKRFRTRPNDFHRRLDELLNYEPTDDDCRSVSSQAESEPTVVPEKFARRVVLPTDQPLDVPVIVQLNRLYHEESKLLQGSQDLAIQQMLHSEAARGDRNPNLWKTPQTLSPVHKELRRYFDLRIGQLCSKNVG